MFLCILYNFIQIVEYYIPSFVPVFSTYYILEFIPCEYIKNFFNFF